MHISKPEESSEKGPANLQAGHESPTGAFNEAANDDLAADELSFWIRACAREKHTAMLEGAILFDVSPAAVFVLYTSIKLLFRVILYELTGTTSELHSEGIFELTSLTLPVKIPHARRALVQIVGRNEGSASIAQLDLHESNLKPARCAH